MLSIPDKFLREEQTHANHNKHKYVV